MVRIAYFVNVYCLMYIYVMGPGDHDMQYIVALYEDRW